MKQKIEPFLQFSLNVALMFVCFAQQVKEVIPDAVKTTGDVTLSNGEKIENFLLVNKASVFLS